MFFHGTSGVSPQVTKISGIQRMGGTIPHLLSSFRQTGDCEAYRRLPDLLHTKGVNLLKDQQVSHLKQVCNCKINGSTTITML